jgi:ferredoxin, 2Fe-2S
MPTIHYILKDGSTRAVEAKPGASVMETAIRGNVRGIDAECGGSCACATCHVYVDEAFAARLPPPDELESEMLEVVAAERRPTSRLSCQLTVTAELDGLTVRVPETQS